MEVDLVAGDRVRARIAYFYNPQGDGQWFTGVVTAVSTHQMWDRRETSITVAVDHGQDVGTLTGVVVEIPTDPSTAHRLTTIEVERA